MKFLRIFGLLTVFLGFAFGAAFAAGTGTPRVTYSFVLNDGIGSGGKTHDTANTGLLDYTNEWGWYDTNNTWHRLDDLAAIPTVASNTHKHFAGYKAGNVTVINRIGQFAYSTDALAAFNTDNTQLIAQWPSDKFRILLNDAGGSGGQVSNNEGSQGLYEAYGECYQILYLIQDLDFQNASCASAIYQTPTRIGYNFKGYYSGQNGSGTQIVYENGDINTSANTVFTTNNSTIYAKWTPKVFTVTLNHQSPTNSPAPSTVYLKYATNWYSNPTATTQISSMTTVPTKTNYDFGGYWTGTNGSGTQVIDSNGNFLTTTAALTAITSNTTIYAKWTAAAPAIYTVTLNSNGGSGNHAIYYSNGNYYCDTSATQVINSNANVFTTCGFSAPTLTNNLFDGYYSNSSAGTQYIDTDGKLTVAARNLTISTNTTWYAHYESTTHPLKCDCGYYVPANSTTCAPCPVGSYCPYGEWQVPVNYDQGNVDCAKICPGATSGGGACSITQCYQTCNKECYYPNELCPDYNANLNTSSCQYGTTMVDGVKYLQNDGTCGTVCNYLNTPANSEPNWCSVSACPANYYMNSTTNQCTACDTGFSAQAGSTKPEDCIKTCLLECSKPTCPAAVLAHGHCEYGNESENGVMNQVDLECIGTTPTCSMTAVCDTGYEPAVAYAGCVAKTYTVTYVCGIGTGNSITDNNATYNADYTVLGNTECTNTGYNFTGWVFSGNNNPYSAGDQFTWTYDDNTLTFTAQWTADTYTATFVCSGIDGYINPPTNLEPITGIHLNDTVHIKSTALCIPDSNVVPECGITGPYAITPGTKWSYYTNNQVQSDTDFVWQVPDDITFRLRELHGPTTPVTYDCGGVGGTAPADQYVNYLNCSTDAVAEPTGCTPGDVIEFAGWVPNGSSTATPINPGAIIGDLGYAGRQLNLVAKWECTEDGYTYNPTTGQCVPCTGATISNSTGTACEPCPDGTVPNADHTQCVPCTGVTIPNSAGTACEPCPDGTVPNADHTQCVPCTGATIPNSTGTACEPCPDGTVPNADHTQCVPCTGATIPNSAGTACEPCPDGTQPNADHTACVPCPEGTYGTGGVCEPCGEGYSSAPGSTSINDCFLTECPDGQHMNHGQCDSDEISCDAPYATIATRTWNPILKAYGSCQIQECNEGYHIASNACVPDDGECVVANGRGTREWNNGAWDTCEVTQCDPGYTANNAGTACERCSNYLGYDGQPAVSSYVAECEIASCMYQGQKYALINGQCESICEDDSDETGSKHWDGTKCVRTCNPGYKMW